MKMNKIIFPLVIALVATLASTGCKKGTPKLTVIPNRAQSGPTEPTDINTKPFNPGNPNPNPNPNPNAFDPNKPIPTTTDINLDNYNQDRAALAAYTVHFKFDSAVVQIGRASCRERV